MSQIPPQLVGMAGPQQFTGGNNIITPPSGGPIPGTELAGGFGAPSPGSGPMDLISQIFGNKFPTSQATTPPELNPFQQGSSNPFLTGELAPNSFDPFANLTGIQQPTVGGGVNNNLTVNPGGFGQQGFGGRGRGEFDGPRGLLGFRR